MDAVDIFATSDSEDNAGINENGGKPPANNPFSFRRFLQNPDIHVGAEEHPHDKVHSEEPQDETNVENPFSFKKWIKSGDGGSTKQLAQASHYDRLAGVSTTTEVRSSDSIASRSATSFQSEFNKAKKSEERFSGAKGATTTQADVSVLPDFLDDSVRLQSDRSEPDLTLAVLTNNQRATKADALVSDLGRKPIRNGNEFDDFEYYAPSGEPRSTSALRDSQNNISEMEATILRLKQELAFERRRSEKFAAKLNAFEEKERSETNALEHAIAQIEVRLTDATRRRDKAEARVNQLERENATLRQQIASLSGAGSHNRDEQARRRCEQAASSLLAAANEGETVLQGLLRGVDKLRLCAQIVNDVYRFEEEPTDSQAK